VLPGLSFPPVGGTMERPAAVAKLIKICLFYNIILEESKVLLLNK